MKYDGQADATGTPTIITDDNGNELVSSIKCDELGYVLVDDALVELENGEEWDRVKFSTLKFDDTGKCWDGDDSFNLWAENQKAGK